MANEPVFISHATPDDDFVTRLHDGLEAAGIDTWVDHKDIITSDNWNQRIQEAVQTRNYCVFVLSKESANNANCEAEWWHYLNQSGRRLYVVLKEPVDKAVFPWRLKTVQYVDLSGAAFDTGLKTLITAIQARRTIREDDAGVKVERRISGKFPNGHLDIPMTGRDSALAAVKNLLKENRRLVVLTAVGGTGKTRLAVEVAVTAPDFTDGVVWLTLNTTSTEPDLTAALRDHLNLPATDSPDAVWNALARSHLLMVLDNAESVPYAERAAIAQRLEHYSIDGGTRVLMTSREQWKETKPFNRAYPIEALTLEAAEQVVRDMAKAQGVEAKLTGREREFAGKAHHHPRLIQYAVSWLMDETLARVIKMLETHTGEVQDILEAVLHSTLRRIEETAGAEVVADYKRLLVCKGGFTDAAADALIGEGSASLGVLRRWNLLTLNNERYTPDLLAESVLEADETAHPAHLKFYKALARKHDKAQDYLGLNIESDNLVAAFTWAMRAGEYEKAYWFYNACSDFLPNRGRFDLSKTWFESVAAQLETHADKALKAAVQNDLGILYKNFPTGSRRDNLKRAIECYQAALAYNTPEAAPLDYAMTQNNLGNAYKDLAGIEDRTDNLRRAMTCYQASLVYTTPQAAPLEYAMTQNNLGLAYGGLAGIEDRADNLRRAMACYQAALVYRTPEAAPLSYAGTQNNLGNAYRDLAGIEDCADNLRRAIECYQAALTHQTPEAAPMAYATTQYNLGIVYADFAAIEDRADNLRRAIGCYQAALVYRTPEAAPLGYAMTQRNIGIVYEQLGETDNMCAAWREAEKYYRMTGYIEDADEMVGWLAEAGC